MGNNKVTGIKDIYELTPMQEGMLYHSLLSQESNTYFEQTILMLEGRLDEDLLEKSFNKLVERYDILRTAFIYEKVDRPVQIVLKQQKAAFDFKNITKLSDKAKKIFVAKFKITDREKGFDLTKGTPIRLAVIKTGETASTLIWSFHHIIMDGWCIGIVFKEFLEIYLSLKENQPLALREVHPYSDYISWLKRQDREEAASYWENYLSGYAAQASLPKDNRTTNEGKYQQQKVTFSIAEAIVKKLDGLANKNNVTLNIIMQTLWGIVLQRYNNTDDVVFGAVVSGRPYEIPGIEAMVGLFINTIPVRVHCDGNKLFSEVLKEVQQSSIQGDRYSYYPLVEIQSKTDLKHNLLDHIVIFENYPVEEAVDANDGIDPGFHVTAAESFEQTNYDFNVVVVPGKELIVKFIYNALVYNKNTVNKLKAHLKAALNCVAANPDLPVKAIEILTRKEKNAILSGFNNTRIAYLENQFIQRLFEAQAARTPDHIAVVYEERQLTYRELNEKANQLAWVLRERGVGPNIIVAIMLGRSLEMVVGILGILKAGGAYLPLDPECPEDRINYMLEDSNAAILVTSDHWRDKVNSDYRGNIISIEATNYSNQNWNPESVNKPNHLAYVIYTSGTTGKPKGVMVEHRSIANTIQWRKQEYGLDDKDCALQLFSYAFDGFLTSFFTPVVSGAKVVILSEDHAKDPNAVKKAIITKKVTHFIIVPSLYLAVLQCMKEEDLQPVKIITLAGEKVSSALIKESKAKKPHLELVNEYGPTENAVATTALRKMVATSSGVIGRPIANTKVYILTQKDQVQPVGVPGEICIAGDGLARGYLNNPHLTAEKFVANPFGQGERMYRTGDLGRWLPDGNIEFLGRADYQIKVRGFRIEPGEIESKLLESSFVKETVVVAKEDPDGGNYLCAYLVGKKDLTTALLREYLSKDLPDYMIPSSFVQLERMPLTPNGKIDRKALPEPDGSINTGVEYVAPANETEAKLAMLWQDILGVARAGTKDNFFELGGHSLKATILVSRIHKEFNVEIPLREIFKASTIAEMAKYINGARASRYSPIPTAGEREYYPMSSAQKRLYILDGLGGAGTAYNMPVVMIIEGQLDRTRFEESFRQLIRRHETLRTSFTMVNGGPVQKVHRETDFNLTYRELAENKVDELIKKFVQPFELKKAPLLRVGLVKVGADRHLMLFDTHHIIADGTSMNLLVREFISLYEGKELSGLRIQYKDYAVWQKELHAGEAIRKQEKYWIETFKGEIPALNLPLDYPRPAIRSFEGDSSNFQIGKELAEKLVKIAKGAGATLYMTLLAALNILLSKYTGQEDIVVGSPIAGRSHAELQNLIGMFVNTLALRNYPQGEKTFRGFLKEVRDNALKAYENQDYQFEELVEKLDIKRDSSRNALFDVLFVLQNTGMTVLEIQGLKFRPYDKGLKTVKFDLNFDGIETEAGIFFALEYCTRLFKKETIDRLIGHFITVIEQVAEDPDIRLKAIAILSEKEKKTIFGHFNNTAAEYPKDKTIGQLFEARAEMAPENIAIAFEDKQLTYRELNQQANRLAVMLRNNGVGPDTVVAIMMGRSPELIVAILGILKAGGAYLPIDPEYPENRIKAMLDDSRAVILLTKGPLIQAELSEKLQTQTIFLDKVGNLLLEAPPTNLPCISGPDNLLYVIYTSGSTGKPKGVMMEHRNLVNLLSFQAKNTGVNFGGKVLQFASIGFDVSFQEIFATLLEGGQLHLVKNETRKDFGALLDFIAKEGLNVLFLPPAYLQYLCSEPKYLDRLSKSVRDIIAAGEQLVIPEELRNYLQKNKIRLHNHYGPTETHVVTTYTIATGNIPELPPIGRPVANTQIYILNPERQMQPVGVAGELYISGDSVGRGYINRPEMTAAQFSPDPFVERRTMYRTGDLARWLPDGNIEFLGRIDHQVKIRGFRIELGEIESQLLKQPLVRETVVVAKGELQESKYLCAYFVGAEELTSAGLREHLSKDLPDYMIPSHFVRLEKMPLTANGKIDRKALPEPCGNAINKVAYEAPTNEVEEKLVLLWREILRVPKVGIKDNFFELGGHSLKAMTLVARTRQEFHVDLPLKEVFKVATVADMANYLTGAPERIYSAIKPVAEREYYPLSSAQKRLYILDQLESVGTAYNLPTIIIVDGKLDRDRLEASFRQLIRRHESLRTSFAMVNGEPVQKTHQEVDFGIAYQEATVEQAGKLAKEFIRPFDLQNWPLLRVGLVKVGEYRHMMLFDIHHIVADGASMDLLAQEFLSLYAGKRLPELRIQYKDYSVWQKELYTGEGIKRQEEYWLETFKGELPVLNLPLDYPRPALRSFAGESIDFTLGKGLTEKLKQIARDNDATLYMTLLAAFNVLLSKYSGQEDIVVGSPIAGRPHADLQNVIGMFVNMLAMRNYPQGEARFIDFLKAVRENALKAYENQDYPYEVLVEKLVLRRDLSRNALFDVMFVLQNTDMTAPEIEELKFTPYEGQHRIAKFDLTLNAMETGAGIVFGLEYCAKLFKKETIVRLMGHYLNILEQVTENPCIRLKNFDLLSQAERNTILHDFNQTQADYPKDRVIQQLFEAQAERTPDGLAAVFEDQPLTYRQLNQKANQLAGVLRTKGVGADRVVGIMAEPSLEMIIGILGILKAGGVYLPIDPGYPEARIKFMLEDSRVAILLTQSHLKEKYEDWGQEIIDLNNETNFCGLAVNLEVTVQPRDLAYIIYTSGTTGKPKGVMIEHQSLVNLSVWHNNFYQVTQADRSTKCAGFGFDASVWEIFPYIIAGATIHIISKALLLDIEKLNEYYEKNQITVSFLPTQLCEQFLTVNNQSLRVLLTGGDKLRKYRPQNYQIVNNYGPTENTVVTTCFKVDGSYANIPIGKPIANVKTFVLGKENQIQPFGIPGELCISGDGLARGYLNNPELTTVKFVANPFIPGSRMYRTGDLARRLSDGNIEFLGRIDHQAKVRGFRVELGEIESCLLKHPLIKEAVAVVKADLQGGNYLCAYFVGAANLTTAQLRGELARDLPDYMIPPYLIRLEKMPLTSNGKIDRRALPEPDSRITGVEYVAPTDEAEARLAVLWQEILGVERVGRKDHFFELGGHSLKATTLISRIHKEFTVEFPLREVFNAPTIAEMASYIKNARASVYSSIKPAEKEKYYPMSSAQKRLYLLDQLDGAGIAYNMPVAMIIEGKLDRTRFETALLRLIGRHETLRTSFIMHEGEPVQKVHQAVDFSVNYLEADEAKARKLVNKFIRPFDLQQAPLLRSCLIKIGKGRQIVLFDMHHIISDGASMNLLVQEFISLYEGKALPELRIQYKDYAAWQKELYAGEVIKKQEKYWLETFKGEIPVLNLPLDYSRPASQSFAGDSIDFALGKGLTEKLGQIARDTGATLYMTLLASLNALLSKYTGQEDIVVGSPIAGRPHADLHNLIGMFVNTLAMRNYPQGEKTFSEFVTEVKENALKAYENQDYPFERLVEKLDIKRDMSRNPLFDVLFVLQNIGLSTMETTGLKFLRYESQFKVAKFDLTFNAIETEAGIAFDVEYCAHLFQKETIERLVGHYRNILEQVTDNPGIRLKDIEILTKEERNKILDDFNNTRTEYPKDRTIQQLFEEQVEKTPDQIAVVYEDQKLTYRQLNEKANQLARTLRDRGVGPDSFVAIMLGRSLEMIVGALGILKAGGAYLPLDPDYPSGRISYILKDSNAALLLTHGSLDVVKKLSIPKIYIEDQRPDHGQTANLEVINTANDLAYVMYTSGSTGKPKGVMVEHKSVIRLVKKTNYLNFQAEAKILQTGAMVFDAATFEVWGSLLNGLELYIVSEDIILDAEKLYQAINKYRITTMWLTAPLFNQLSSYRPEMFMTLQNLLVGGDKLSPRHINKVRKVCKNTNIINGYGPTENTTFSTCFIIDREYDGDIPIGKPISNTTAFIVNKHKRLQGIGVVGELCLGGDGLARGYLNNPELTAAKFVRNPFGLGERMYCTGDLARWLPDGNIEFLGRIDQQVKIRGYRIELGEIESQLLKHPLIKETAVVAKEDAQGGKYLCAYFVGDAVLTTVQLREHLAKDLPEYMIPSCFAQLEKLPLNINGKIDGKALPEPDGSINTGVEYVAPRNDQEKALAQIWRQVLRVARVGIKENFFSLGGDSIKAIQVLSRLNSYGLRLEMSQLFRHPVIEELSGYVKSTTRPIGQGIVQGEVSLTPIQSWFFAQNFTEKNHFNQAVMLAAKGGFREDIIGRVLAKLVERHDALRMVIKIAGDQIIQFNRGLEGQRYSLEVIDINDSDDYRELIAKEADRIQRSIDLEHGPLIKAGLFKDRHGDQLLIVIHHLVVDGVSWRIILEDLATGYLQGMNNEEICLAAKTDSFRDWAERLSDYAHSEQLLKEIEYWRTLEKSDLKKLPKDRVVKERKVKDNGAIQIELDRKATEKLLKQVNKAYNTEINDILLTALGLAVKEWTGENKVLINLEGHGREAIIKDIDINRTVGWFTVQYPVILDVSGDRDLSYRIKSIKESLRKIPNKGIGYGILKYLTQPEKKETVRLHLEPELSFNYLGQFDEDVNTGVFEISDIPAGEAVSPNMETQCAINISGMVVRQKLLLGFTYNKSEYSEATIFKFVESFRENLLDIMSHCAAKDCPEMTPSDFTENELSFEDIEDICGDFE